MKFLSPIAILLCCASSSIAEDKQTLQGSWKVESVTQDGNDVEEAKGSTFTFKDSKFTGKGKQSMQGTYTLAPEKSPKQMDFTVTRKDGNTMTMPMIYKIEKKQLTICAPRKPDDDRPTEFKSEAGTGWVLIVMQKMEEKTE